MFATCFIRKAGAFAKACKKGTALTVIPVKAAAPAIYVILYYSSLTLVSRVIPSSAAYWK